MKNRLLLKQRAINLRKQGFTYTEILTHLPLAKSTLSSWLHTFPINKSQRIIIANKLTKAQKKGAKAKRKQRIEKTERIQNLAKLQIRKISNTNLLYMGTMLYWAEGSKQKDNNISQQVAFSNSDPKMCQIFLKWIRNCIKVNENMIIPIIYIHNSLKSKGKEALNYWSKEIGIPKQRFGKTCYTNTKFSNKHKRKDNGKYYGQLRIRIKKSADINRKISGWIEGIYSKCLTA